MYGNIFLPHLRYKMKKTIYYIFLVLLLAVMGTAGVMLYREIQR